MTFRYALIISTLIHSTFIMPFFNKIPPHFPDKPKDSIMVEYVTAKEPDQRVEIKKAIDIKPVRAAEIETVDKKNTERNATDELAKRQVRVKSTKDYISYYELLREKIKRRLKLNYSSYYKQGEVSLVFELDSNGRLVSLAIENASSTTDKTLRSIAASSVKEASPFPAFPKALALPRMSFNLVISFKRD
jgi:outer membrane biosynthesis protein TonB